MKNDQIDDIITNANQWLKDLELSFLNRYSEPEGPVFFIVGAPRSGTTILLQAIINHFDLGYINNLIARFWDAPVTGAAFFRAVCPEIKDVSYESRGGFTDEIHGPHEFGYFWRRFFLYGETHALEKEKHEKIDKITLKREIAGLEKILGRPMIFKNPAALSLQIDFLGRHIPGSYFIYIRRDPFYVAQSLYRQRLEIFGNAHAWYSVKPASFPKLMHLSPVEQVAGQALDTIRKIEEDLSGLPENRVLIVDYENFCRDPLGNLSQSDVLMRYLVPGRKKELENLSFKVKNDKLFGQEFTNTLKRALTAYKE